jgi:restriction system protein
MKKYRRARKGGVAPILVLVILALLPMSRIRFIDRFFRAGGDHYSALLKLMVLAVATAAAVALIVSWIKKLIRKKWYLSRDLGFIDRMPGGEFEALLKAHFEQLGYRVSSTPATNDYGVDLVCRRRPGQRPAACAWKTDQLVVQAKRYSGKVGIAAVQQIIGGMRYYNAPVGLVVTNSYFTQNARKLAAHSNVILWDRNSLRTHFGIPGKHS